MLTLEMRPQTFSAMAGQDLVRKSLLHICKDPSNSPHTILLEGSFGSGKTTAARIFAKALNCPNQLPNGDACGKSDCPICGHDIQDSMFYSEYDSAVIGNVENIKQLRNTFYFGYEKGYKVIVLDETHLCSKASQGALLKVFEEPEPNVFFVLCTTDPEKLLPTIVSRSLELKYTTVPQEDMLPYLQKVLDKTKLTIPDDEIEKNLISICEHSHGHMRNAIMLLDSMYLLQEDFKDTVKSSLSAYIELFTICVNYKTFLTKVSQEQLDSIIDTKVNNLTQFTMSDLQIDYERFVLEIIKSTFATSTNQQMNNLVAQFKNSFKLINVFNDKIIYDMFKDDILFKSAMYIIINKLKALK